VQPQAHSKFKLELELLSADYPSQLLPAADPNCMGSGEGTNEEASRMQQKGGSTHVGDIILHVLSH